MVGVMDGVGEGWMTTIQFTPRRRFGFGNDGRGRGEWGIMVGGAGVIGNEKEDVKSSETSLDVSSRDDQNRKKRCVKIILLAFC